jgi:hypothetical protein
MGARVIPHIHRAPHLRGGRGMGRPKAVRTGRPVRTHTRVGEGGKGGGGLGHASPTPLGVNGGEGEGPALSYARERGQRRGEGGAYLCASPSMQGHRVAQALTTLHDGGPPTGTHRGQGAPRERGRGKQTGACIPTPHTPFRMQACMRKGEGTSGQKRRGLVY